MTLSGTATVRAERTKLWTLAGVRWLLAATVVALVTMGAAIAATLDTSGCRGAGPGACAADPVKASLGGVWVAQVAVVVLGVLAMSTEYDTPQIRVTLAAMPRRVAVLLAKAGTVAALVAGVSGLGTVGALVAGRMVLAHNGFAAAAGPALSFTAGSTVRAAAGTVCYLVLVAVLALGLATLVRDAAVGVVSVLALLYLFPLLGVAVNDPTWQHRLRRPVDRGHGARRRRRLRPHHPFWPNRAYGMLDLPPRSGS